MTNGCRPLSDSELSLLLSFVKNIRDRALIILGIRSGFRISELLSLRVSQVSEYGKVSNRVTVSKQNMKGKVSSRSVPLHQDAVQALESLITTFKLSWNDYLFQSRKGYNQPLSACQAWRIITNAAQAAKLTGKIATHSMRKSYCERVHKALGENIFKTQKAMGHKSPNSTVAYLNVNQDEIDDAILSV